MKMSKSGKDRKDFGGADSSAPQPDMDKGVASDGAVFSGEEIISKFEEHIEKLEGEVAEWKDRSMRAQAEFENIRKRLEERHAEAVSRAGERLVTRLIPVIDDLDYAIGHAETDEANVAGLIAIRSKFLASLEQEGVTVLDPKGEPFDHDTAQAVQMVGGSGQEENTVVSVLQKGYQMGSRVLRPAMVTVSDGTK